MTERMLQRCSAEPASRARRILQRELSATQAEVGKALSRTLEDDHEADHADVEPERRVEVVDVELGDEGSGSSYGSCP